MKVALASFALSLVPSAAEIVWKTSQASEGRRLALSTHVSYPQNKSDPRCTVSGYDAAQPTLIFVGGPCSEIDDAMKPTANFAWIEMGMVDAVIENEQNIASTWATLDLKPYSSPYVFSGGGTSHSVVTNTVQFQGTKAELGHAALHLATTGFLLEGELSGYEESLSTLKFAVGEEKSADVIGKSVVVGTYLDVCVKQCCTNPGTQGCACSDGCPMTTNEDVKAQSGGYKYSMFTGAYDEGSQIGSSTYTSGAAGNGWEYVVAKYGVGSNPRLLKGRIATYQFVDFTHMKDASMIITSNGNSLSYESMTTCNLGWDNTGCVFVPVSSLKVGLNDKMSMVYQFPHTYNRGTWVPKAGTTAAKATPEDAKVISIQAVRPSKESLVAFKVADTVSAASSRKVLMLKFSYETDSASLGGRYFVYEPRVTLMDEEAKKVPDTTTTRYFGTSVDTSSSINDVPSLVALVVAGYFAFRG